MNARRRYKQKARAKVRKIRRQLSDDLYNIPARRAALMRLRRLGVAL